MGRNWYWKDWAMLALVILLGAMYWTSATRAQTTTVALQLTGSAPHTTCAVTPGQTTFCFASDGLWQSLNGGAYIQLGGSSVTSVNGKTGAVVISATTTATTTLQ